MAIHPNLFRRIENEPDTSCAGLNAANIIHDGRGFHIHLWTGCRRTGGSTVALIGQGFECIEKSKKDAVIETAAATVPGCLPIRRDGVNSCHSQEAPVEASEGTGWTMGWGAPKEAPVAFGKRRVSGGNPCAT